VGVGGSGSAHFVQGSGKTAQIREATTGPCANEALLQSMQHLHKPGLIPVRTRSGETLVVGQVQVARVSIFGALNIFSWHAVHKPHAAGKMQPFVSLVGAVRGMKGEEGTVSMKGVKGLGVSQPSRLEAVSPMVRPHGASEVHEGAERKASDYTGEGGSGDGKTPD